MLKTAIIFLALGSLCLAQPIEKPRIEFSPKKYICFRTDHQLSIDGKLEEPAWGKAKWTDDFVDIEGPSKPAPRFRTRAKMLWDEKYFYIAAELSEPDIWGTLKNRDDIIFYDNDFEIFIDPNGDTHSYSEFEINALNTFWDLFLKEPYRDINKAALHGWDIKGILTGVAVYGTLNKPGDTDSCWTVEVAFPWEAFKEIADVNMPPQNNDQWRINFSRVEWKTEVRDNKYQKQINPETNKPYAEDNWVWSPQGIVNMHYPEMWGYVQFSDKSAGSQQISFIEKEEEVAKWLLREIYYAERIYFQTNGIFSTELKDLGIELKPINGFSSPPKIEITTNLFEASLRSDDGSQIVHIRYDGLTWITNLKGN